MKVHLLYRDRDLSIEQGLPSNESVLTQDLALDTLFNAMACGDKFVLQVVKQTVLSDLQNDIDTILYRQAVFKDCLRNLPVVEQMYGIAVEAIESKRKHWWFGHHSNYPSSTLHGSVGLMQMLMETLGKLRQLGNAHASAFESEGFTRFFSVLRTELADEYFARVKAHLKDLKFRQGVLISAQLGPGNQGGYYILRKSTAREPSWIERLVSRAQRVYTFHIAPRDEGGARALGELRDRGINFAANALAQSADHILSYFVMLQRELAFYLACANLHRRLMQKGVPVCFPFPLPPGVHRYRCVGLRDVCLVLTTQMPVMDNDLDAEGKKLRVITGANQGGSPPSCGAWVLRS